MGNEYFAKRIKQLRKEKKLTGEQLGAYLGVKKTTISGWERGVSKPPTKMMKTLADFFDVTIDYLIGSSDLSKSINDDRIIDLTNLSDSQIRIIKNLIEEFLRIQ